MVAVAPIGIKPPVEAVLQLGGMEATFEGQAEACGCSLDGDDPSLGGWDGLRGWAVGNHGWPPSSYLLPIQLLGLQNRIAAERKMVVPVLA